MTTTQCALSPCPEVPYSRGMCSRHYHMANRSGWDAIRFSESVQTGCDINGCAKPVDRVVFAKGCCPTGAARRCGNCTLGLLCLDHADDYDKLYALKAEFRGPVADWVTRRVLGMGTESKAKIAVYFTKILADLTAKHETATGLLNIASTGSRKD